MSWRSPWSTDELEMLRDTAARFLRESGVPNVPRWEQQHHVDRDFWLAAGELGLLCPTVPEEYGGAGGNVLHQIVITEEQIRAIGKGWGSTPHSGVVPEYLLRYGTEEQKQRWLPGMVEGTTIAAICMSEPDAGSDLKALRTQAVARGDTFVLSGTKTFVTNGTTADFAIVAAKTDPSAGARGVSLFLVDLNETKGIVRGQPLRKMGQHAADTAEIFFDDAVVPSGNLLGPLNGGFGMLMQRLPEERLLVGVSAVVPMEVAVALATEHAKSRRMFGGTLFDLQNTKFELAECATIATVARTFLDHCVARHLEGDLDTTEAAKLKWWTTDMQWQVVDRCLQLFGGYGYMAEYPISRMLTDARAQRIYGGANEVMKDLIARSL
ncbi:acyl-CoA dehydrogenase family protein [Streptomyces sp. NPDC001984]